MAPEFPASENEIIKVNENGRSLLNFLFVPGVGILGNERKA